MNKGEIRERVVYIYEETQSILGTNSLRRNELGWLAKCISVGANYGLSLLIVTRRAAEVSTQIFEHSTVKCVTNSRQPNSLRKLRTIFDKEEVEEIKNLGVGEFLVLTPQGVFRLKTSIYKDKDPQLLRLETHRKKPLMGRVKEAIKKMFEI